MIVLLTAGLILLVFTVPAVIYYRRRKLKAPEENKSGEKTQKKQQFNRVSDEEIVNTEEVTYASVQINKATTKRRVHAEPQEQDDSVIYSTVKKA
ncbi:hypothetical protein HF521_011053 [Silurus meridionalis]|uniref:Uncharacterized protein n=2 Tax=Silurus meridionalis TaxID=175797 RepID=A0A8T0AI47_SILME|nr:hypothetical protein HF521_011053 [Silurus meridionalis]